MYEVNIDMGFSWHTALSKLYKFIHFSQLYMAQLIIKEAFVRKYLRAHKINGFFNTCISLHLR